MRLRVCVCVCVSFLTCNNIKWSLFSNKKGSNNVCQRGTVYSRYRYIPKNFMLKMFLKKLAINHVLCKYGSGNPVNDVGYLFFYLLCPVVNEEKVPYRI